MQSSARVADHALIPVAFLRLIILRPALNAKTGIRTAIEEPWPVSLDSAAQGTIPLSEMSIKRSHSGCTALNINQKAQAAHT